jgi:transcriptional regulator with XRE-family HTH domain
MGIEGKAMVRKAKLRKIRITEGWTLKQLAAASNICETTLRRAERGEAVREDIWGKIMKGINGMEDKSRTYKMDEIRP